MTFLYVFAALVVFVLLISCICFRMAFYSARKEENTDEYVIPKGKIYEPFRETMVNWMKEVRAMPH